MDSSFFTPYFIWFFIGFVFVVLELAVPGFILFFFGIGAWLTAFLLVFVDFSVQWQLAIFIVSSLVSLLGLRRFALNIFQGFSQQKDASAVFEDSGQLVEVVEDILLDKPGQIKYRGSFWKAVSSVALKKGEMAILSEKADKSGIAYVVLPVKKKEEEE